MLVYTADRSRAGCSCGVPSLWGPCGSSLGVHFVFFCCFFFFVFLFFFLIYILTKKRNFVLKFTNCEKLAFNGYMIHVRYTNWLLNKVRNFTIYRGRK